MKILNNMCRNVFEFRRKLLQLPAPCSAGRRNYSPPADTARLRILFFGTDNFSLPSLQVLNQNRKSNGIVSSLEVVTSFKAKRNPLKRYSEAEQLRLHDWPLSSRTDVSADFDLGVVVSFGHLIPESLIRAFRLGMLNVHASLLPKLRGAAPIVHAIRNGETETGITIMKIRPKHFDVGEILTQRRVPITENMLMPELHSQLAEVGASALLDCIENLDYYYANLKEQNNEDATYAPKIDAHFCEIRWAEMTAKQVYDLYRSLYSYKPLVTRLGTDPVKIFKLSYQSPSEGESPSLQVGHIQYCRKRKSLRVGCRDGKAVHVELLSIGGKKAMSSQEFYNGFISKMNPASRVFR